jgi:hypothetical protein
MTDTSSHTPEQIANIQGTSARSINFTIGVVAMLLGPILIIIGCASLSLLGSYGSWTVAPSISEYYYFNSLTQGIFIGSLGAIGMLISAYRGWHRNNYVDRGIAVLGLIAAWMVALVPCYSADKAFHYVGAATLFLLMAIMLAFRFTDKTGDADEAAHPRWKNLKNWIYRTCAAVMFVVIAAQAVVWLTGFDSIADITLQIEAIGLFAFSIGWLTKSRFLFGYKAADGYLHWTPTRAARFGVG